MYTLSDMHWPIKRPAIFPQQPASRFIQAGWLLFALLALSLALPGIVAYQGLLAEVCAGAGCLTGQLSAAEAQALLAAGRSLVSHAQSEIAIQVFTDGLTLALAAFLIWRKPHARLAVFAAFVLVALAMSSLAQATSRTVPSLWLPAKLLSWVQVAGLLLCVCLIPDGRIRPAWLRGLVPIYAAASALVVFVPAGSAPVESAARSAFGLLTGAGCAAVLLYRYRHAPSAVQKEQIAWALAAVGLAAAGQLIGTPVRYLPLPGIPQQALPPAVLLPFSMLGLLLGVGALGCLAVALLGDELFDVEVLLNRALVYASLTVFVVVAYGLVVGALSVAFQTSGSLWLSLAATGLVAVLFQPLRAWLQRLVNRLMYGERDDPYAVLARFGQHLEATLVPDAVLPAMVETVTQALKLPYAAVRWKNDTLVAHGVLPAKTRPESFALRYQGETLGQLEAAPRAAGQAFTAAERRLLTDIAQQAGVAAHAVRLTDDLRQARERLVTAREEERRRLQRDLHDGLGPKLAGQALILEAIRDGLAPASPSRALVDHLIGDSQTMVAEIRELVQGLRPLALDELGLVAAVRAQAAHYETGRLRVAVDAPDRLPPLPAAVEVAAYRIIQEAFANVVRHAEARSCTIRISLAGDLQIEIQDDGIGLLSERRAGLGLGSMRERAEEIGGQCRIEAGGPGQGGTRVVATLPIALRALAGDVTDG